LTNSLKVETDGFIKSSAGKARKPPPRGKRHAWQHVAFTKDAAQRSIRTFYGGVMFEYEAIARQPLFYLFVAFSALLSFGYFWGKRVNERLFRTVFEELVAVVRPVDQTFTNIGGLIGYHASLTMPKKGAIEAVNATITFLPRHSWLWMPISKLIRKYDRLFITLHLRQTPIAEGHLIEAAYARFRGPKITNAASLNHERVVWGNLDFLLYHGSNRIRDRLRSFVADHPDPGTLRHIAIVPEQKKCFIFMIPLKGQVARSLSPVYQWIPTLMKQDEK